MQTVIPASPSIDHFRTTLFPDELMEPFLGHAIHDPGLAGALLVDLGWKRTTMSSCLQCGRDEPHDGVAVCHVPPGNPPNPRELRIAPSALRAHCEHGDSCGPCDDGGTKDASAPDP
jgi:hypothetical protein